MKNIACLFLLICLIAEAGRGQTGIFCDKIIVGSNVILESCINEDKSKTLNIFDARSGEALQNLRFSDLKNSLLADHPLVWDVLGDSVLFWVRTYSDQLGMTYTDLLMCNIDTLIKLDRSACKTYLFSNDRIVVKHIMPVFMYALRVAYRADSIKGPVYFDMRCDNNSLSMFVYVNDYRSLEKWNFNWYPAVVKTMTPQELRAIFLKDQWQKVSEYSVSLNGPFKVLEQSGREYIITRDRKICYLGELMQPTEIRVSNSLSEGDVLLIEKGKGQARAMSGRSYNDLPDTKRKKALIHASRKIVLKP